jgi:hypothetical protein
MSLCDAKIGIGLTGFGLLSQTHPFFVISGPTSIRKALQLFFLCILWFLTCPKKICFHGQLGGEITYKWKLFSGLPGNFHNLEVTYQSIIFFIFGGWAVFSISPSIKHCNLSFFVIFHLAPALRKPVSWSTWRKNFAQA